MTTSIDSISSGLMSLIRLGLVPPIPMLEELLSAVMRTPSMMYSGSLLSDKLLVPRIRTREPAPVRFPARTSTPGAFALSKSFMFAMGRVCTSESARLNLSIATA